MHLHFNITFFKDILYSFCPVVVFLSLFERQVIGKLLNFELQIYCYSNQLPADVKLQLL